MLKVKKYYTTWTICYHSRSCRSHRRRWSDQNIFESTVWCHNRNTWCLFKFSL